MTRIGFHLFDECPYALYQPSATGTQLCLVPRAPSTYQAPPMSSAGIPSLVYGCAFNPLCNKQSLSLFQSPRVTNTPVKHTLGDEIYQDPMQRVT